MSKLRLPDDEPRYSAETLATIHSFWEISTCQHSFWEILGLTW